MVNKKSKIIAFIMTIVFSFVMFGSLFFIIVHSEHDCTGENCQICIELIQCKNTLNTLGNGVSGGVSSEFILFMMATLMSISFLIYSKHITLISLKVELLS